VQNVFNKEPPAAAFFGAAPAPGIFGGYVAGDDPIGRYYTAGVRLTL
jgi:outer membrane receptor protein involved in Fe transport